MCDLGYGTPAGLWHQRVSRTPKSRALLKQINTAHLAYRRCSFTHSPSPPTRPRSLSATYPSYSHAYTRHHHLTAFYPTENFTYTNREFRVYGPSPAPPALNIHRTHRLRLSHFSRSLRDTSTKDHATRSTLSLGWRGGGKR